MMFNSNSLFDGYLIEGSRNKPVKFKSSGDTVPGLASCIRGANEY